MLYEVITLKDSSGTAFYTASYWMQVYYPLDYINESSAIPVWDDLAFIAGTVGVISLVIYKKLRK